MAHLVGALEPSGLEVGAQTTARLESAHELSTETILTDLVNDVDLMAEETVVALDDDQVIDNAAVHEATAFLLEHLPDTWAWPSPLGQTHRCRWRGWAAGRTWSR